MQQIKMAIPPSRLWQRRNVDDALQSSTMVTLNVWRDECFAERRTATNAVTAKLSINVRATIGDGAERP
jgi:hypothetical protein